MRDKKIWKVCDTFVVNKIYDKVMHYTQYDIIMYVYIGDENERKNCIKVSR